MPRRPTAAFLLSLLLACAACGDRTAPTILDVSITPNVNPAAPLAAMASVRADEPVTVTFRVEADGASWEIDPGAVPDSSMSVPVLGFRAGTSHRVTAVATDAAGNETASAPVELVTDPLPDDFPIFELKQADATRMERGATLFPLMKWPDTPADDYGAAVVVDHAGHVVWYYLVDHPVGDARLLPNGHMTYQSGRAGPVYEVDMLGNVVAQWHATEFEEEVPASSIAIEAETVHHEVLEMPSGNLLIVSTEVRDYAAYPTSTVDPAAPTQHASVVGDVVFEFARDGRTVRELKLLDILDPMRTGSGTGIGGAFWQATYGDDVEGALVDWAHTNAVFYDEASNAFIISARVQDAVVKFDADSGEIIWILGEHARWGPEWSDHLLTPVGELEWQNHQHAPMVTEHGTILLFDNGTNRGGPREEGLPASEKYSRAVEYAIDEEAMEVRQVWSYGGRDGEWFYSSFISDADWLPETDNVLITAGGVIEDAQGVAIEGADGRRSAHIMEVTHETPSVKVFELVVRADWESGGWHVYRAQRIPSLYGAPR